MLLSAWFVVNLLNVCAVAASVGFVFVVKGIKSIPIAPSFPNVLP